MFKKLNRALVLLRSFTGFESAQIPPLAGLVILLPGIESIFSGRQFPNHDFIIAHTLFVVPVPPFVGKFPQIADSLVKLPGLSP
jgi:hypothetical protein